MSLFKHIAKYYAEKDSVQETPEQQNSFIPNQWKPLVNLPYTDTFANVDMYRSYVYACIHKTAMNVAKADNYIYNEVKSKKTIIEDHPFKSVLKTENTYGQSFQNILYLTTANLKLHGEAFWYVVSTKTFLGNVLNEIIILPSKYVTKKFDINSTKIIEFIYNGNGKIQSYSPDEIIHFVIPNPMSNVHGFAPVSAFNFTIDIDYFMGRYAKDMFKNNASLEGVYRFPTNLGDEQYKRLKQQDRERAQSKGQRVILEGGATYEKTQGNLKEMTFTDARDKIRDEIFVIMDVPKSVMNVTDQVNYANAMAGLRTFMENSVIPFAENFIESKINSFFRKWYGEKFLYKMEYELTMDRELQLKYYEFYMTHNIIKKETIRELDNFTEEDAPNEIKIENE